MAFDPHTNLGIGVVATAPAPALSGTSLTLTAGMGALFPAAPFNCTVWAANTIPVKSNAQLSIANTSLGEIVRVTNVATDTFTITRGQEGTNAVAIAAGYLIANTVTAKDLTDIEANALAGTLTVTGNTATNHLAVWSGANGTVLADGGAIPSGNVTGPGSSTDGDVVLFSGTTGQIIKDSGSAFTPTGIGLGNVTNDAQTKAAIMPNTAPSAGQIPVGNAGGAAYAPVAVSGDATLTSAGAIAIAANAVTNAKAAQMAANTIKGNNTGSTANAADLTASQVTAVLQGDGSSATQEGFRGIPQNSQSANYTTVLADAGKHIYHPGADTTARTWTIDSNANVAYAIGTTLTFVNDTSAGVVTIAITSDTLVLAGAGTTGSRTLAANGIATAIKMTSTRWQINGTGLT